MRNNLSLLAIIVVSLSLLTCFTPDVHAQDNPPPPPTPTLDVGALDAQAAALQQAAANAQAAAQAAVASALSAQQRAADARNLAEQARLKAQALEAQAAAQLANDAQSAATTAGNQAADAISKSAEALRGLHAALAAAAGAVEQGAAYHAQAVRADLTATQLRSDLAIEQANKRALIESLTSQLDSTRVAAGALLCALLLALCALVMVTFRLKRYQTVIVDNAGEPGAPARDDIRLPAAPRIVTDPSVIDRLDDLAEGAL